ncbi:hypothetical protein PsorP6_010201 [Peronosclerospora sorghi]|uniref:Uncharacterized protein n=1 Tax=Peronosclerospora sorghi TaxID=230839 RepID=A0ACC0VY19_9STRA|nr:hypothetical protein PsorP6_010201 [Peronosclerospora sorghi]
MEAVCGVCRVLSVDIHRGKPFISTWTCIQLLPFSFIVCVQRILYDRATSGFVNSLQVEGYLRDTKKDDDTSVTAETAQAGGHVLSRAHLVHDLYEWYSKTFLCMHEWKRRSRGNGQRVSHNVQATKCPAKVCATLQRSEGTNEWNAVLTKHFTEHNHELSEALYLQYSEVRRVRDPKVLAQAEQLWRVGATRRHVFEFLKERSPNQIILMKDMHNLFQRWQTQEGRSLQDQQQESETQQSPTQPQNTLSIGQDNEGVSRF